HRAEAVDTNEVSDGGTEGGFLTAFARHAYWIPERAELLRIIGEHEVGERTAGAKDGEFHPVVGHDERGPVLKGRLAEKGDVLGGCGHHEDERRECSQW